MKRKKIILFLVAIIVLLSLTLRVFATEEVGTETNDNTSSGTENNNENNSENNGNNDSENNNDNNNDNNNNENNNNDNNNENQGDNTPSGENEEPGGDNTYTPPDNQDDNINNENYQEPISGTNSGSSYSYTTSYTNAEPAKSSNANLKSLVLNVEGMSPEFSSKTTEYYITIDLSVSAIDVQASAEDEKATVTIAGNNDLQEGQNTIEITVVAEDGTVKNYKIYVTKTDDVEGTNANLKTLTINGWTIYPNFKPNIYSYSLTLDQKLDKLNIVAETENEEATFEIVGNENLEDGNNLIKIIVTAKNGETTKEYKINAFVSSITVKTEKESKHQAIILLIILGLAIGVTGYLLAHKK